MMDLNLPLLFCTLLQFLSQVRPQYVETSYGDVVGSYGFSSCGRRFEAYRGIPYAQPPVGDLRFKAPTKPDPWFPFALDATREGPVCIQRNFLFSENPDVEGQEDCLYLNVYTPEPEDNYLCQFFRYCKTRELLPVMVFIHWGGFLAGRGTSDYLGPEYFMDEDVVLVTFNYRLGVMGFLSTLDDEAPGNYALKDQVAALEWVQENICYFYGDPSRVTIFGQSAGGGSTHYHLLSPLSKGLFQNAISQSGSALALWAKPFNIVQPNVTAAVATAVGCVGSIGDNKNLIDCLRNVSADELVVKSTAYKYFSIEPLTLFTTVVEKQTERNPRPFFTKEPLEYIQSGEFQKVPWMIGLVQNEGILRAGPITRQSETLKKLNKDFASLLPQLMGIGLSNQVNPDELYQNITKKYLGKEEIDRDDPKSVQGFIDLYTDRAFAYPTYQSAMLHVSKNHSPIWFYNFDYKGDYSYGDLFAATEEVIPNFSFDVSHCDDLLYLFYSPALFPPLLSDSDVQMKDFMIKLFTNFATTGHPAQRWGIQNEWNWQWPEINKNLEDGELKNEHLLILNITNKPAMCMDFNLNLTFGYHPERMRFWENQQLAENFGGLD